MKSKKVDVAAAGGHVCFLYESAEDRLRLLAKYFEEGLAQHELCILVVPEEVTEITERFEAIGFDASLAIKQGALRVFEMQSTYLPHGKFIAEYMLQNINHFIEDAKSHGYTGLRTAGEMSWINHHPDLIPEARHYEDKVNNLVTPESRFIGLCLYPVQKSFEQILTDAMYTHPGYIHNNEVLLNPRYRVATA